MWVEHSAVCMAEPCVLIFAHSMGNLILAGALERGLCQLTSAMSWFAIGAPWLGTRSADSIPELCSHPDMSGSSAPPPPGSSPGASGGAPLELPLRSYPLREQPLTNWPSPSPPSVPPPPPERPLTPVLRELARREGYCDGESGTVSPAYASLFTEQAAFQKLERWRERVNGSMCGISAFGLWSLNSFEMQALEEWVHFDEPNDGVVPAAACLAPLHEPTGDGPESRHYTAGVNHFDLTCRHGDGWWGSDRKPCAWYKARAEEAIAMATDAGAGWYRLAESMAK